MKLKTRTNQPVYYKLPVSSNIQSLSDDLLNSLRVGDVVQKKTGNQKHCYVVTYKEEKKGICLTYVDCGYMETISYDYTAGHWVYNSKDVCEVASLSGANFSGPITSPSIIQNMNGFSFEPNDIPEISYIYAGVCQNGNKLTFVLFGTYTKPSENPPVNPKLGTFIVPSDIGAKLYPYNSYYLNDIQIVYSKGPSETKVVLPGAVIKRTATSVEIGAYSVHGSSLTAETPYLFRIELTFLLSDNLVPSGE